MMHSDREMVAAVILAAGSGSRFVGPEHKLLAELRGKAVVEHAVDHALAAGFDHTIVVTGAADLSAVLNPEVLSVRNSNWALGQASSLLAGIAMADELGCQAVVIGLGDTPDVGAEVWQAIGRADGDLVVAVWADGGRRPPVKIGRSLWSLLPTDGDEGARVLFRERPELVCEVACGDASHDIDTREDLAQWS